MSHYPARKHFVEINYHVGLTSVESASLDCTFLLNYVLCKITFEVDWCWSRRIDCCFSFIEKSSTCTDYRQGWRISCRFSRIWNPGIIQHMPQCFRNSDSSSDFKCRTMEFMQFLRILQDVENISTEIPKMKLYKLPGGTETLKIWDMVEDVAPTPSAPFVRPMF